MLCVMFQANTGGQFACNGHLTRTVRIFSSCDYPSELVIYIYIYGNVIYHKALIEEQLYGPPQTDETSSQSSDPCTTTNAP
jgi:hypothetical protein